MWSGISSSSLAWTYQPHQTFFVPIAGLDVSTPSTCFVHSDLSARTDVSASLEPAASLLLPAKLAESPPSAHLDLAHTSYPPGACLWRTRTTTK